MKRSHMKVIGSVLAATLVVVTAVSANADVVGSNVVNSNLSQANSVVGGGDSSSSSSATSSSQGAWSYLSLSTTSNVQGRTAPLPLSAPYLPLWNHGGWGTVKGYFANGPTGTSSVYERMIDPADKDDMRALHRILESVPYTHPLQVIPGLFNGLGTLFGAPDNFHHGRGFEIANTVIRDRRPEGKRLMVFIDTNVDKAVLQKVGYAYVGKISIEGTDRQSWDQVYSAAIAEALPWNVDILLVSGGMKGVTVGQNVSFPSAAFGYSQTNYSLSLTGGQARGVTEGKGKPVLSAEAFAYYPKIIQRQSLPREFYKSLQLRAQQQDLLQQQQARMAQQQMMRQRALAQQQARDAGATNGQPLDPTGGRPVAGVDLNPDLYDMAGVDQSQQLDYLTTQQVR